MRTLLCITLAVIALVGCSNEYYPNRDSGYYGGGYSSGGSYYGGTVTNYSYYYPFGNVYYPRDRIWIVESYGGCRYYTYRGYCYRYKDDFDRAIIWDNRHGYDSNWYQRRLEWCRYHDCHHDNIVRDAQGRPLTKPVYRSGMATAPSSNNSSSRPVYSTYPQTQSHSRPTWQHDSDDRDDDDHDDDRGSYGSSSGNQGRWQTQSHQRPTVVPVQPQPDRSTSSSGGTVRMLGSSSDGGSSSGGGTWRSTPQYTQPVVRHARPVENNGGTNGSFSNSRGNDAGGNGNSNGQRRYRSGMATAPKDD